MKRLCLILACLYLFNNSCKKSEHDLQKNRKVTYSYGNYNETDGLVTAELDSGYLSIGLGPASLSGDKGGVIIQLEKYTGPGIYAFGDEVIVRAENENLEDYWEHFYYNDAGKVYGDGKVTIKKLTDERIEATVQGKLFHLNGQTEIINTDLRVSINSYR